MGGGKRLRDARGEPVNHQSGVSCFAEYAVVDRGSVVRVDKDVPLEMAAVFGCAVMTGVGAALNTAGVRPGQRSEEHTSELQSLMRISYAVFCLKKKKEKSNT